MRRPIAILALLIFLTACGASAPGVPPFRLPPAGEVAPVEPAMMLEPQGFTQQVHDPVIAEENGRYTVFSTGNRIPMICSSDMLEWEQCGRVFERNPAWTREVNPDLTDIWAPDISYFNGLWHLYYAVSAFGTQNSGIGLATNATLDPQSPDYEWVDQGLVLRSNPRDPWNAIDPNLVMDENGEPWLAWGSFWDGLFMAPVDSATGQLASSDRGDVVHLANRAAGGESPAIEAPFIVQRDGKWYLFASFDQCCQGANSTYNLRVGRSDALEGPYVDCDGVPLLEGGGTKILCEYGQWKGPGHNGMLVRDGTYWMVYHAYDANQIGVPKLRIESLAWDDEGWPSLPSQNQQSADGLVCPEVPPVDYSD